MKNIKGKWTKYRLAALWLIVLLIILAVSGSFAAYTSFNSVKRVVSTGKTSDTLFGSNYLSLVNINDTGYKTKHISPSEVKDGSDNVTGYKFTVLVCNYIYGNKSSYNTRGITYNLKAVVKPIKAGADLPSDIIYIKIGDTAFNANGTLTVSSQSLSTGAARENSYTFYVPANLKDQVKIEIVAEPVKASAEAVNNQKLAAVIAISSYTPTENWTGRFLDNDDVAPGQYDGFNYEISGNGTGSVTITWHDYLQISPWFIKDVDATQNGNSCKFSIKSEDISAYQFQFYRTPGAEMPTNWPAMERDVEVSFQADGS